MVSSETTQSTSRSIDSSNANANANATAAPRISFSADPNKEETSTPAFISMVPKLGALFTRDGSRPSRPDIEKHEFEFLSSHSSLNSNILTADELFSEGKLLPFWQAHHPENRPACIGNLRTSPGPEGEEEDEPEEGRDGEEAARGAPGGSVEEDGAGRAVPSWFMDDDPSPRPPKCTVLWKELLRLRNRPLSTDHMASLNNGEKKDGASGAAGDRNKDGNKRAAKKGLERTRSGTLRIRPMINVPICSTVKGNTNYVLPPSMFPAKKGRLER